MSMTAEQALLALFGESTVLPADESFDDCAGCKIFLVENLRDDEFVGMVAVFREKEGITKPLHECLAEFSGAHRSGNGEYVCVKQGTGRQGCWVLSGLLLKRLEERNAEIKQALFAEATAGACREENQQSVASHSFPNSSQRLARMRESFEKEKSVLADDYAYFTTPRESIHPNKAGRKSAEQSGRRSPERSETRSSDKTGD
jgi:hypothetical protein